MNRAAISFDGLGKSFGATRALENVCFSVPDGAFACLVGPSGCGKTTLLRILAGLDTASRGRVLLDGLDATRQPPAARGMGIVFQSYALFPNLTAAQNVSFGLHGKNWPHAARKARALEMLELVGLADLADRRPGQLSGGQQQRVALARALAPKPRFLLLDEPLSALDPHVRASLRAELKDVQRRLGVTTVMVTHDQEEALALSDMVVVLRAGRVEQAAAPRTLIEMPATAFVADFVAGMNVLDAEAISGDAVRIGDWTMSGVAHGHAIGSALRLAAPPDQLCLTEISAPESCPAVVRAVEYAGRLLRVIMALGSGGATLRAHAPVDSAIASGDRVGVMFEPSSLRIYAGP